MSRVIPHLALPTGETPLAIDPDGYLLDEDGQVVWEDVTIDNDEDPVLEKVGPLNDVPSSLVLLQSIRQTRALYLSTLLPLFSTRSKARAQPSPAPAVHTQVPLGRCTLQIGPCSFPETRIYEIRYSTDQELAQTKKDADDKAKSKSHAEKRAGPAASAAALLAGSSGAKARPAGDASAASGSTPRSASGTNITPELIAAVNAAASTDTNLQTILALAASGKATTQQLQFLGGVIGTLQKKKGIPKTTSTGPSVAVAAASASSSAAAAASSSTTTTDDAPPPSPAHLPPPTTRRSAKAPPTTSASDKPVSSDGVPASTDPVATMSSATDAPAATSDPTRPAMPHDIVIEFEENKTDRFLLPLYRCLVSRDPLPPSDASPSSPTSRAADSSVLSTIRLSFFLPLSSSVAPPTPALAPPPPSKPAAAQKPSAIGPARPYVPPPVPEGAEEGREGGSVRARASREKALREKWDRDEAERVEKETKAAAKEKERLEKEERDREREANGEGKKRKRRHALGAMSGGGAGGEAVGKWPTTVVMEGCSEAIWESVSKNWEGYVGVVSPADGVEGLKEECADLLAQVPPKTYLQTRLLSSAITPAMVEASTDKFTLKPYLVNGKAVTRSDKEATEAEQKKTLASSRKRKATGAGSPFDGVEVEGKRLRKPSAKVQETMSPALPSPSLSTTTAPKSTKPTPKTSTPKPSTPKDPNSKPKLPNPKPHHPAHWGPNTHPKKAIPKPPLPDGSPAPVVARPSPAAKRASTNGAVGKGKAAAKASDLLVKAEPKKGVVPKAKGKGRASTSGSNSPAPSATPVPRGQKNYSYVLVDEAADAAAAAASTPTVGTSRRAASAARRSLPAPPPAAPVIPTPGPAAIIAAQHAQSQEHDDQHEPDSEVVVPFVMPQFDPDGTTTTNGLGGVGVGDDDPMAGIMGMFDAPLPHDLELRGLEHHHDVEMMHHHHADLDGLDGLEGMMHGMEQGEHGQEHVGLMDDYLVFDDD